MKLKYIVVLFLLANIQASDEDVQNLCQSLKTEFKETKKTCHVYYEWADFFSTKIQKDAAFSVTNREALNAFFTRAAGFGGFDFSRQASPSSSLAWHVGIKVLYTTGTCHADFPVNVPNPLFAQYITQIRETYCYKTLSERLFGFDRLIETTKSFKLKVAQTNPKSTVITPFFVGKNGELYVLASTDVVGYSAAYGGAADGKPQEKLLEEFDEECAGFFWHKDPSQKVTGVEQKVSEQLSNVHERLKLYKSAPSHYHLTYVNTHCVTTTWVHTDTNHSPYLDGVVFLPIEVLSIGVNELANLGSGEETPVKSLLSQLGYAKKNLDACYRERGEYTLIQLKDFLKRTKKGTNRQGNTIDIPNDRFGRAVRFGGNHLKCKEIATIFQSIGLKAPRYQELTSA